jgi:N6-adenosine-specific RNA methylase IME4
MIPFPKKKYNIIYADPAWKCWFGGKKNASNHYSCMDLQSIKNLPIKDITADNCILFMWVIFPLLPECIETMKSWGFRYSTCGFTWVKKNKKADSWFWGCGYYTRANAELCLIGTKGIIKRVSKSVHQIIDTRIENHSKKPDIVRKKILELCGDLPRIELFARQKVDGWDCWGNEV